MGSSVKKDSTHVRESLVEALSQSSMLQFLGKSEPYGPELREMLSSSEVQQFFEGETIISEGDESDRMYLLASGSISISVNTQEICTMTDPGEIFGEFGVLTGELRSATVRAIGEVTCLAISPVFTSRISLQGDSIFSQLVQRALTKVLLGRLRHSNEELATTQQALDSAEERIAFLRVDNEILEKELAKAKSKISEGLRGTRAGDGA